MFLNLLHKKTTKIFIVGISCLVIFSAALYSDARKTISYSNDKDTFQFVFDVKDQYTMTEGKDVQVTFVDTTTNKKPIGYAVTMQVDNGPARTIVPSASEIKTRFANMGNLNKGVHQVIFTIPDACGNFFDFSKFDGTTKFNNIFDCQYVRNFLVSDEPVVDPPVDPPVDPLDPTGPTVEIFGCTNPAATNYSPAANNNNGSCIFPATLVDGCTDVSARNFVPTALNDDGSCQYHTYGCTDQRATNYNLNATAIDGSCNYPGEVTSSDFECSVNNSRWFGCEGRTFTLLSIDDPIYVRTEPGNAGTWLDWCTGDLNNGVQASFTGLTSNNDNAQVNFTFAKPGSLFNMTLCLDPRSVNKSLSFDRIKLKILDTKFIEN